MILFCLSSFAPSLDLSRGLVSRIMTFFPSTSLSIFFVEVSGVTFLLLSFLEFASLSNCFICLDAWCRMCFDSCHIRCPSCPSKRWPCGCNGDPLGDHQYMNSLATLLGHCKPLEESYRIWTPMHNPESTIFFWDWFKLQVKGPQCLQTFWFSSFFLGGESCHCPIKYKQDSCRNYRLLVSYIHDHVLIQLATLLQCHWCVSSFAL